MSDDNKFRLSVTARVLVYVLMVLFIEFAKEFKMVGAENLKNYDWAQWLVLAVGAWANVLLAINIFFDNSSSRNGNGNGRPKTPPAASTPTPGGEGRGEGEPSKT